MAIWSPLFLFKIDGFAKIHDLGREIDVGRSSNPSGAKTMSDQPADSVNPYAKCEPGTDTGEYILDDGLPRVWDGTKWLSPREALEAEVLDKDAIKEELSDEELGHLKAHGGSSCLWKIPGYYVLDLTDSDYANAANKPRYFDYLEDAKAEFWNAIKEAVESGEVSPEDIGKKVHYRSVYSEDCGGGL